MGRESIALIAPAAVWMVVAQAPVPEMARCRELCMPQTDKGWHPDAFGTKGHGFRILRCGRGGKAGGLLVSRVFVFLAYAFAAAASALGGNPRNLDPKLLNPKFIRVVGEDQV